MRTLILAASLAITPLYAQNPSYRGSIGFSGGSYEFDSDLAGFDERADAGLFVAEFEATSASGYGGGLRYEGYSSSSSDGLFRDPANPLDPGTRAQSGTFQAHFTYLVRQHRFEMPVRAGLFLNGLVLDDRASAAPETTYGSFGPYFEVEPELTVRQRGQVRWTIFGQLGFGVAGTGIDVDGDARDYTSDSGFFNLELGTRVSYGVVELGLAFVGRYHSMDSSSIEAGQFVYGFDAGYEGLLLTAGVRF